MLRISFDASPEQVSLCLVLACKLSPAWTVAWQHPAIMHEKRRKENEEAVFVCLAEIYRSLHVNHDGPQPKVA